MFEKKYDDETFITMRRNFESSVSEEQTEPLVNRIENGFVQLDGYRIQFSRREIANTFSIMMPTIYDLMEPQYIKIKYPAYQHPNKIIYTNAETTVNLLFHLTEQEISEPDIEMVCNQMSEVLKKMHPSSEILSKETIELQEGCVAYFDLVTPALDQSIYNFLYFFECNSKLVSGTMNCLQIQQHHWSDLARQMVETIAM